MKKIIAILRSFWVGTIKTMLLSLAILFCAPALLTPLILGSLFVEDVTSNLIVIIVQIIWIISVMGGIIKINEDHFL